MKISACLITFNEEAKIGRALQSLEWADEIVVVDSESTDNTRQICEDFGVRVITQEWLGFSKQKQYAVDQCSNNWVFSLDADEVVSNELANEILKIQTDPQPATDGYKISRLSYYMDSPIYHCGWYPDWQLRFFDRRKGAWKDVLVHESFQLNHDANVGKLSKDILHYSVESPQYHNKMIGERYAPLAAEQMFKDGRSTSRFKIATVGFTTFLQTYLLKGGFLDGFPGFCIARFAAHHAYLKHLFLWDKLNATK